MFFGSVEAGTNNALLYTLLANCHAQGLDHEGYLIEVLKRLPHEATAAQAAALTHAASPPSAKPAPPQKPSKSPNHPRAPNAPQETRQEGMNLGRLQYSRLRNRHPQQRSFTPRLTNDGGHPRPHARRTSADRNHHHCSPRDWLADSDRPEPPPSAIHLDPADVRRAIHPFRRGRRKMRFPCREFFGDHVCLRMRELATAPFPRKMFDKNP